MSTTDYATSLNRLERYADNIMKGPISITYEKKNKNGSVTTTQVYSAFDIKTMKHPIVCWTLIDGKGPQTFKDSYDDEYVEGILRVICGNPKGKDVVPDWIPPLRLHTPAMRIGTLYRDVISRGRETSNMDGKQAAVMDMRRAGNEVCAQLVNMRYGKPRIVYTDSRGNRFPELIRTRQGRGKLPDFNVVRDRVVSSYDELVRELKVLWKPEYERWMAQWNTYYLKFIARRDLWTEYQLCRPEQGWSTDPYASVRSEFLRYRVGRCYADDPSGITLVDVSEVEHPDNADKGFR